MTPTVLVEAHHRPSQTTGECLLQISRREEILFKHTRLFHDSDFDEKTCEFSYEEFRLCVQELRDNNSAKLVTSTHEIAFFLEGDLLTIRIIDAINVHIIEEITLLQLLIAFELQ